MCHLLNSNYYLFLFIHTFSRKLTRFLYGRKAIFHFGILNRSSFMCIHGGVYQRTIYLEVRMYYFYERFFSY